MPMLARASSWKEIVEFYTRFASVNQQCHPMRQFVSQVAASKYAEAIFPKTSMHTLIVSQVAEFEWNREILKIDCSEQEFHFEYFEQPNVEQRWAKECCATEGFSAFERSLALKKWFT
ncbi:MAG: hypothetical protein M3397_04370 [Actinomycetota bacterium]|nr:hypothetical protein [Actinomycetota bacterium]